MIKIFVMSRGVLYELESFKDDIIWLKGGNEALHITDPIIDKIFSAEVVKCLKCRGIGNIRVSKHMSMKCEFCAGNGKVINDNKEIE